LIQAINGGDNYDNHMIF